MIRTSSVVPLGKAGSVDLTRVAGMPGAGVGRGALSVGVTEGAEAAAGVGVAESDTETGVGAGPGATGRPSMAVRRHCGCGPAATTAISSLAPGGICRLAGTRTWAGPSGVESSSKGPALAAFGAAGSGSDWGCCDCACGRI